MNLIQNVLLSIIKLRIWGFHKGLSVIFISFVLEMTNKGLCLWCLMPL